MGLTVKYLEEVMGSLEKNGTKDIKYISYMCSKELDDIKTVFLLEKETEYRYRMGDILFIVRDKIPYTILRLPLVYGPRSIGGLFTCFKLINKGFELNIGKTENNVAFVKDVIEGMIMAAESPATVNQTYCLGENRIYKGMEIIRIIKRALGRRTISIPFPYPLLYTLAFIFELFAKITGTYPILRRRNVASYIKYCYWRFSMSKAKIDFDFEAKVQFELGAKITADWYKQNQWI